MEPHLLKIIFPHSVILLLLTFCMITPIHFYDESFMSGGKISNIISYDMLS